MNTGNEKLSVRQQKALETLASQEKFTGKVAFIGGQSRGDQESTMVSTIGRVAVHVGFDAITTGSRSTAASFLDGATEIDGAKIHVVIPWVQSPRDQDGRDVNYYADLLGEKRIDIETLEEVPDPEDKEQAKAASAARITAKKVMAATPDAESQARRMFRRLAGALLDLKRFEKYDEAHAYCVTGSSDGTASDAQVAFVASMGMEPIDQATIEPLIVGFHKRFGDITAGNQKILVSEAFCIGIPERHADILIYLPEPGLGGGAPMNHRRYAESLGIPCLHARKEELASWLTFFRAAGETILDKVETEEEDLQSRIDAVLDKIETEVEGATAIGPNADLDSLE